MSASGKGIGFLGVIAIFLIVIAGIEKLKSGSDEQVKRIDQEGVLGVWYDEVGEAETTIEYKNYSYRLKRVNSDGSKGNYRLTRDGDWLRKNDSFDTHYQIVGDRLDVFDRSGFIKSLEPINNKK